MRGSQGSGETAWAGCLEEAAFSPLVKGKGIGTEGRVRRAFSFLFNRKNYLSSLPSQDSQTASFCVDSSRRRQTNSSVLNPLLAAFRPIFSETLNQRQPALALATVGLACRMWCDHLSGQTEWLVMGSTVALPPQTRSWIRCT